MENISLTYQLLEAFYDYRNIEDSTGYKRLWKQFLTLNP